MAVTLTSRSIGLMVATAVTSGWLAASLTQPPAPAQSPSTSARRSADPMPAPHAERLRQRLAEPPLPNRGRNPFVYGTRAAAAVRDHQQHGDEATVVAAAPLVPVAPPEPIFRLSGIASNTENGVAVMTAIVIDGGTMVFVKAGEKLSNGYSVVSIDEMSVTLVSVTGVTQTLRLP